MNTHHKPATIVCACMLALMLSLAACTRVNDPPESSSSASSVASSSSQSESTQSIPEESAPDTAVQQTALIKDTNAVSAGISESNPDVNVEAVDSIRVENMTDSGDVKGLLRVPLPAAMLPDALISAQLRLKRQSGDANPQIIAMAVTHHWDRLSATWNELKTYLPADTATQPGAMAADDWYELDVTGIVRDWLSGKYANNGILLEQTQSGVATAFYSTYSEPLDYCPELVIEYQPTSEQGYGTFLYQAQESGNCLSFALRDTDPIFAENLQIDTKVLQQQFNEGGADAALDYVKTLAEAYVEQHADTLEIVSLRAITGFDAEIDPASEYRIALRIGIETEAGLDDLPDERASFDFHLQAQLADGSWAEKFGAGASRIIPGSNAVVDPGLAPWDQNELWGMSKFSAYYDSKTVYYAVQKAAAGFTAHGS